MLMSSRFKMCLFKSDGEVIDPVISSLYNDVQKPNIIRRLKKMMDETSRSPINSMSQTHLYVKFL